MEDEWHLQRNPDLLLWDFSMGGRGLAVNMGCFKKTHSRHTVARARFSAKEVCATLLTVRDMPRVLS